MFKFIKEFARFLKSKKKLWLLPLILVMVILGGALLLAGKSTLIAPFIYTLF
jgi:Family of unknown function (DUF5989)